MSAPEPWTGADAAQVLTELYQSNPFLRASADEGVPTVLLQELHRGDAVSWLVTIVERQRAECLFFETREEAIEAMVSVVVTAKGEQ